MERGKFGGISFYHDDFQRTRSPGTDETVKIDIIQAIIHWLMIP